MPTVHMKKILQGILSILNDNYVFILRNIDRGVGGITVVYSVVSGGDVYVCGSILTTMMFDDGVAELCVHVCEYCEYMTGMCVNSPIECVDRLQTLQ